MRPPFSYRVTLGAVLRGTAGVWTAIWLCLTAAIGLAGLSIAAGWLYGVATSLQRMGSALRTHTDGRHFAAAAGAGCVIWLGVPCALWLRRWFATPLSRQQEPAEEGGGGWLLGAAGTLAALAIVACICFLINRSGFVRGDRSYMYTAACLLAGAVVMALWTPAVHRAESKRSARAPGGWIEVRCPVCGYALTGMTELLCPECGETFTIDGLIRAQGINVRGAPGVART
jgi:hypothetical protein